MSLHLTPDVLRAGYDFLNATLPFSRWNLPDGDDLHFEVSKGRLEYASIVTQGKKVLISLSAAKNGHTTTLLASLAHEMIHLHESRCKIRWRGVDHHGAAFRKWAKQVCDAHGFDLKLFY